MNEQEQRIAIAEACGWTRFDPEMCIASRSPRHGFRVYEGIDNRPILMHPPGGPFGPAEGIPDYLNDLNAMHEAEKVLGKGDGSKQYTYWEILARVCGYSWYAGEPENRHLKYCIHATASQRAEALLRTLGLWKD